MPDQTTPDDGATEGAYGAVFPEFLTRLFTLDPAASAAMAANMFAGVPNPLATPDHAAQWGETTAKLQAMWSEFQARAPLGMPLANAALPAPFALPAQFPDWQFPGLGPMVDSWMEQMPFAQPQAQKQLWEDGLALWQGVLGQCGIGGGGGEGTGAHAAEGPHLPREDKRFADPKWRDQPFYALVHQTYLLLAEQITALADATPGLDPARTEQMRFMTRLVVDALSPDHFLWTNPLAMERAIETGGQSLIKGMEHLIADIERGQLTHTDPDAFKVGENIAMTPGKVVHESAMFQLIQYTPVTEQVMAVPLVIFPPWINRFYILDLNPAKSFVRWAVEQGLSVFMVSWKSADESMAEVTWDDYVRAQIEAIDVVRARLEVPAVHAVGYCVAGTTLAATLAVMARRGEAERVRTATFFTAQVDFEKAGELKHFVDDQQIAAIRQLAPQGYLDGRYMAATFNLLRSNDLIWSYVINNYLLGKDYPTFDLLHWNGDTTNLPVRWHIDYLQDLYRDNRLATPDSLSADGTPIDLGLVQTPAFIQAGRDDHIAPAESVWRMTRHLRGERRFVLAGSGHIASVVNPPAANKYQYWTLADDAVSNSYEGFLATATEHKGSWWPHWLGWLRGHDDAMVAATGRRVPGSAGDTVIEDAPGRYVRMH
jgi:polyhydroxyalkanoate synthase